MLKRLLSIALMACTLTLGAQTNAPHRVRTIITTDGEVDDQCSLVRYMVYSNMFELEGLVSSSSKFHYVTKKGETFYGKDSNQRWIDAYSKVYPNLSKHAEGFPTPEYLTSINVEGNIYVPGEMVDDTPGARLIEKCIMDEREDPLLIQVWGGTNTLARALKSIEQKYRMTPEWPDIYKKVCKKVQVWIDLDQDNTVNDYILHTWPGIRIVMSYSQFFAVAYGWRMTTPDSLKRYYESAFMEKYIANKSNPLSEIYYNCLSGMMAPNPMPGKERNLDFLSEGDTPNYFYILDNGLRSWENPSWGGWAGRFIPSRRFPNLWIDAYDDGDLSKPIWRWTAAFQTEFAARMKWCTESYDNANHEPVVEVEEGLDLNSDKGKTVTITAKVSDPDGDKVNVSFWQYGDADTYGGQVELKRSKKGDQVSFVVPEDARPGDTIHIIVEAQDQYSDPDQRITRYKRVVVTVGQRPRFMPADM